MKSLLILGFEERPRENIVDFFSPNKTRYREMLANPGTTRYGGWDLQTLDYPKIRNADHYEVTNGERKTIRLYQDGSVVAKGDLGVSFLGHASDQYAKEGETLINPIALLEFIYNFVEFTLQVITEQGIVSAELKYMLKMSGLNQNGLKHSLSTEAAHFFGSDARTIEENVIEDEIRLNYNANDRDMLLKQVPYSLAKKIYLHFGFEENLVPLFNHETGEFRLDLVRKM